MLTGAPLVELKTCAVERVAHGDRWDERQYEMYPPVLKSPYAERRSAFGKERYSALGIAREDWEARELKEFLATCGIEVRREMGSKNDDPAERFEFLEQHIDDRVRLAEEAVLDRRGTTRRDRVSLVEQKHSVLFARQPEHRRHVLRCFAHPE